MNPHKFFSLLFSIIILLSVACKVKSKNTITVNIDTVIIDDTTILGIPFNISEEAKWDSVRYFKDVIYTSNKGIHQLQKDALVHPYAALSYSKTKLKISAFFNANESYHTVLTKENGRWKAPLDSLIVRKAGYDFYVLTYFLNDSSLLNICYELIPSISVTSVSKLKNISTDSILKKWYAFSSFGKIGINTVLRFNDNELKKLCTLYGANNEILENKGTYTLYAKQSDEKTPHTLKMRVNDEHYNSYFFNKYYNVLKDPF